MSVVKFIDSSEYDRIQTIATYCFPWMHDASEKVASYLKKYVKPEYVLGYYDQSGTLMAAVQALPFSIMVGGVPLEMGGIAMVSSMPEGRHGGRIATLLKKWLEIMKEKGQVVSMLGPFSFEFYRKYGWELAFERLNYTIPIEYLRSFSKKVGNVRPIVHEDIPVLDDIYTAYTKQHNGCVVRDEMLWADFVLGDPFQGNYKKYAYIWMYDDGKPGGYIIYTIRDGKMNVHEMIYKDILAEQGLLWFIYAHQAQIKEVNWSTATDEHLHVILPNPRVDMKLTPGMMFRVVDVEQAILKRGYSYKTDAQFSIQIDDPCAPWNQGPWHIIICDGHPEIEKCGDASLYCDIQSFSQIFLGYITPWEAAALGKLKGDAASIEAMTAAFPKSVTFNNNGF